MTRTVILSALDGTTGFTVNGANANDFSGRTVSAAGDINGDGIDDVIIGASSADPDGRANAGQTYVLFGSTDGFAANLSLSSLDGSNGFVLNGGDADSHSGGSVSAAGDINDDGFDDIIIGTGGSGGSGETGKVYIIYGNDSGYPASVDLSSLNVSSGFVIRGAGVDGADKNDVRNVGDVNGDGFDDVIIGASTTEPYDNSSGESYVVFGQAGGFGTSLELSSLDGSNGFTLNGINQNDSAGYSVSGAGDINGDGFDDIIIGARFAHAGTGGEYGGAIYRGEAYVVFGSDSGFSAQIDLSSLSGDDGFVIAHSTKYEGLGASVSTAGDINGDGFDDIIIGAPGIAQSKYGPPSSSVYVVFGSADGFTASLDLASLDGSNGFALPSGGNSRLGSSVSAAGDVNGDGLDDIIVGASNADPFSQGASYVIFGSTEGFSPSVDLSNLDPSDGFVINGKRSGDFAGTSVSAAGDVNGDGFDDLIIGAVGVRIGGESNTGQSYIIFGSSKIGSSIIETGTVEADDFVGSDLADSLSGAAGNDTLSGGLGADTLLGSSDNDLLDGGADDDFLRGDAGHDVILAGSGNDMSYAGSNDEGNDSLDGGTGNDTLGGGAGNDQIDGGDGDDVLFGAFGADETNGGNGNDTLFGGAGDDTLDGGAGADSLYGGVGDDVVAGSGGADSFFFAGNHGADVISDFDADDVLVLVNAATDFTDLASFQAAARSATVDGQTGLLIDTGGGNSIFLAGASIGDIGENNLIL